jgi:hypothetical protein
MNISLISRIIFCIMKQDQFSIPFQNFINLKSANENAML